jgi:lipopolysaccharide/colanic/teichoic acid biosynthesis glycosyltransferase
MTVGAEEHLDELLPYNERNGPLFKMEEDPRVTRVGAILRSLSIDELPQLWNVLRGDMSLVGPRPALPSEARCFGERLQTRTEVLPGVTGLWQVEARSSGSMRTYERLDLFYIENWSVGLDLMVIIATLEEELVKAVRRVLPSERDRARHPSVAGAATGAGPP